MTEGTTMGPTHWGLLLFPVWSAFETWSKFPFLPCFLSSTLTMDERKRKRSAWVAETSTGHVACPRELTPEACHGPVSTLMECPGPVWKRVKSNFQDIHL